ncbi:metalloprotease 1 [Colletotrichum tabaci]|uniref:Metalloprotease 1 n=1 Tax=Colletotrichum tabaci TaxID=1209068 RepID=A0AAV9TKY2_9PEZI
MVPLLAVALLLAAGISPTLAQYKCANINVALDKRDAIVHPAYYKRRGAPKPVDVYFHVTSTEAHKDRITDTIVDAQFKVMQSTYQRHGFELNLVNVSRIVDDVAGKGFYGADNVITDQEAYMSWRRATRRGGYDALNVYFFSDLTELIGGHCLLPTNATAGTDAFYQDGCWINGDTMPGLGPRSANGTGMSSEGHIGVHEVGHWFGLLHTFEGDPCNEVNDGVADTPTIAYPSWGCPIGRDSCPGLPGLDAIHNFMDYSSCMKEFTVGQEVRMHQQFDMFRRKP